MGCEGMGRAGRYVGGYAAARRSGGCAGSEWDVLWCRIMARDEGRERSGIGGELTDSVRVRQERGRWAGDEDPGGNGFLNDLVISA